MLILRLAGGLGNQIFQLGAALIVSKKAGFESIIIDDSALGRYNARRENNLEELFDFSKIDIDIKFHKNSVTKFRLPKVLAFKLPRCPLISDRNFEYMLTRLCCNIILMDGYFQWVLRQDVFDDITAVLQVMFKTRSYSASYDKKICAVHIRGGDFVKLGWNKITPAEYYIDAMRKMTEEFDIDEFMIVTDDLEYSNELMDEVDMSFRVQSGNLIDDFYKIASCPFRILSSSTFAFWGSVLGNNDGGAVIAPEYLLPGRFRDIMLPNEIRMG